MVVKHTLFEDFFGQSPIGSKTSVLLANKAQAGSLRTVDGVAPVRVSREQDLQELIVTLRRANRSHKVTATLDMATHALIHNQLLPTGEHVPVFPYFSRSGGPLRNISGSYIEIDQNKVTSATLADLQSQFAATASETRPKIVFVVGDRDRANTTFAKLNSVSDIFTPTPNGIRRTDLPDAAANDFERLFFTRYENHRSAALATLPETDDARVDFINRLMILKSQKATLDPSHLLPDLKALCDLANRKLVLAPESSREFWASAWIHTLVEQAYIQENAKLEIQSAMGMLSMIQEQGLAAHVLRFSNQVLGTSPQAISYLEDGRHRFENLPVDSYSYQMYQPSYLGLLQNLHVTELYQPDTSDAQKAEESYRYAVDEAPYFTNLGMLGNTAALGYLISGDSRRAVRLYDELLGENADEFDRWSIKCNRLIAQEQYFGEPAVDDLEAFAKELSSARVSPVWEYHILRFALNIIQIDHKGIVKEAMWDIVKRAGYFDQLKGRDVRPYQEQIISKDFHSHTSNGRLSGQMGNFFYQTGIFPSSDFDWS